MGKGPACGAGPAGRRGLPPGRPVAGAAGEAVLAAVRGVLQGERGRGRLRPSVRSAWTMRGRHRRVPVTATDFPYGTLVAGGVRLDDGRPERPRDLRLQPEPERRTPSPAPASPCPFTPVPRRSRTGRSSAATDGGQVPGSSRPAKRRIAPLSQEVRITGRRRQASRLGPTAERVPAIHRRGQEVLEIEIGLVCRRGEGGRRLALLAVGRRTAGTLRPRPGTGRCDCRDHGPCPRRTPAARGPSPSRRAAWRSTCRTPRRNDAEVSSVRSSGSSGPFPR